MNPIDWFPSISITAIFAAMLWLARNLIATRLTKSVQHEFDTKLESVRADLRSKEAEIAVLRGGAMTAMASRQMSLDRRRLEAVDQLWSAVTALAPAKAVSSWMAVIEFDQAADEAQRDAKVREFFRMMGSGFDPTKVDSSSSEKARPFVSPMAWALFSAYQAIALQAVVKLAIIKSGMRKEFLAKDVVAKLVKSALPHYEAFIDEHGDAVYHLLLNELETRLLDELQNMLAGVEADKASVAQAANIVRLANEVKNSTRQCDMPPDNGLQGEPPRAATA